MCDRNIGKSVKVRSVQNKKVGSMIRPLVVCLECHRTGVTVSNNAASHMMVGAPLDQGPLTVGNYLVLDNLKFPIFDKTWSAREELLLL